MNIESTLSKNQTIKDFQDRLQKLLEINHDFNTSYIYILFI
jgi:hypothetical protein